MRHELIPLDSPMRNAMQCRCGGFSVYGSIEFIHDMFEQHLELEG